MAIGNKGKGFATEKPQSQAQPVMQPPSDSAMVDAQKSLSSMQSFAGQTAIDLINQAFDYRSEVIDGASTAIAQAFHPDALNADIASAAVGKLAGLERSNFGTFSWGVSLALPHVQHSGRISLAHLYPVGTQQPGQHQLESSD